MYRRKIERLLAALENETGRSEAEEIIRSLIESIVVTPEGGVSRIGVKGDLATMLMLAA